MNNKTVLSIVLVMLFAFGLYAQESDSPGGTGRMGSNLAQQARNPTASLTMMQIIVNHNANFYNLEGADQTGLIMMPIIPFKIGKQVHIARIVFPYVAAGPDWGLLVEQTAGANPPPNYVPTADKTGLGDMSLFDLLIFPAPWKNGQIAGGVSAILPTATDPALGTEKWSVGPAFGGLVQSGALLVGGIVMTNFSVAGNSARDDVRAMTLQPFGSIGIGNSWSLELSEMMSSYNFSSNSWTAITLGGRIGKLTSFGNLPVRFFADAEYNFVDKSVAPEWTFRFGIVPLL